jgi:nitrogen fixation/metabolism regulation signal transduction histidine kinase
MFMEARKHDDAHLDNAATAASRRAPKGVLIRPRQQFRYAFVLVAGGIIAQSVVIGAMAYFINSTIANVVDTHQLDPAVGSTITHAITLSMSLLMLVAIAFAMVAVLIGVKLSHRIYGPLVPFNRHIDKLKEGHYSTRMNLRRTDDLVELKDALNGLAEALQARHGTR